MKEIYYMNNIFICYFFMVNNFIVYFDIVVICINNFIKFDG